MIRLCLNCLDLCITNVYSIMNPMEEGYLTIEACAKKYNLNTTTLRRWVKKGLVSAVMENKQYLVDEDSLIEFLERRNIDTNPQSSTDIAVQLAKLEKEIEMYKELVDTLKKENEFLRGQLQQLTNTINILTTRQLPEPKGFIDRIKGWFRKE